MDGKEKFNAEKWKCETVRKGVDHWAGLLPKKLFDRAETLDEVSEVVKEAAGSLEDTYTVEFSGGGSLME